MNNELNAKIDQIRKKYELERQKLFDKYQTADRERTVNSPIKSSNPERQTESYKEQYEKL